ncbi:CHAT domain-containing protein [Suillus clintonianus]|uniref:CHAT domain-containing protein n=1 Tax=Suillus clintonianus TaxID=1904413 RepID=UPI001B8712E0|nr:CHAT domain-containing protein [Suillus clintonianus]KAG2134118.1 CHAT domain-containing protein [Suillus clintonianus]
MPGSAEIQSIRLEIIGAKNLRDPSKRVPAGIYVSIDVDSRRRWKSAISVLSSDGSVAWGDTMTLSSHESSVLSIEIRASFELDRTLGNGEIIGRLQTSWDELLDHGDEQFELSFPVRGVNPSLMLKATVVHASDNQDGALLDPLVECEIARETDAGHVRFSRYIRHEKVSHLNGAVERFQLVLDRCPVDHPDHAAALTNLAWARLQGYIRNDLQDIDTTTSLFREALALRPQGHPDHILSLFYLIFALIWRYSKECTAVFIHESLQLCCKLLPLCPEGTYLRSISVDIAVDYVIAECTNPQIDASDEGIHLGRVVLELCPLGQKHHARTLDNLARSLLARFTQRGSIDDLEESIQLGREVISLCPEGHSDSCLYLNNLAFSLQSRFDHQGKSHDLDEVISMHEEAQRLWPVRHESRDFSLDNLGRALRTRFDEHGDVDDINRAVSLHREALTLRPLGHPHRDNTLNNLAAALQTRYGKLYVIEDLNEAIDLYRESLRARPLDHPERHVHLYNLSSALCSRFTQIRKNEDVEEAIRLCQESLVVLPLLHPDRYFSLAWLQEAYLSRYQVQHNPADLSLAVENYRLASRHPTQGFPQRIIQACNWTITAEQHGDGSSLEAYSTIFELLDAHLGTRSSATSRREAAAAFHFPRSLPVDAASCAIRSDNLRRAVELVEQGRGQQWSLASRLKTPVEDLESGHPHLARNFLELSKRVSNAAQVAVMTDRAAADQAATEYRRLTAQWDAAVAEIRNLRAFSRFLLPPSFEDLQAAARNGPVIILIASQYSCGAIVVPTSGELHHIPLSSVTLIDLENLKSRFARAIQLASQMGLTESRTDLIVLLRIVWDNIMLPIVNVLEHVLELKRGSRIWLCPTAAFTSIPLHAAHPFQTKADRSGKEPCLEDLYICSYTPTLSALIRSRQMMKERRVPPSFVAVGQGQPGGGNGKALLAVDSELELVNKLVPATANRSTVSGDAATRAGALEALEQNTWVHLACHGKQDHKQPYDSHFVMKDAPLTLLDIMEKDIPHAEFAFLSACHTAVGDEETPDEVIHLAAGLQFSGFKSVIGTLWEVDDAVAKHVVEAFYENMVKHVEDGGFMDCTKAAWALNRATHAVKTKVPLEQRMVFIHIGV